MMAQDSLRMASRSFFLAGITGTNGKTTLTYLLRHLWAPYKVGIIGTIQTLIGDTSMAATLTTPDAAALSVIFEKMKEAHVSHVALEVSSHALQQKRVHACDFDVAVFTNLTQDHLDYHRDMETYYQAKKKFFTEVLSTSTKTQKLAVINRDDPYGLRLLQEITDVPVQSFSLKDTKAHAVLLRAEYGFSGTQMKIRLHDEVLDIHTNLIGQHNVQNILAALLVAATDTDVLKSLQSKLENVTVPGRLERVGESSFFVDYAHTPDALKNVLSAMRVLMTQEKSDKASRLIVVFGCGGDRDEAKRPLMGAVAAEFADVVIVTSDNPRTEDAQKILNDILAGVVPQKEIFQGVSGYLVEIDRERALAKAVDIATDHDVVVVAGKGHEDYQIIGTTKYPFDDRKILEARLA